jgi:hypothetical protein
LTPPIQPPPAVSYNHPSSSYTDGNKSFDGFEKEAKEGG